MARLARAVLASPAFAGGVVVVVSWTNPVLGVRAVVVVRPSVRAVRTGAPVPVTVTVAVRSVLVRTRP
ncbi:hypothetical protein Stsp02_39450 [Streptomyces sp. NBRC 14336]|nr:hypothetical protein Stsp02_39450 [Streptomyces sp. NBRC 14336]